MRIKFLMRLTGALLCAMSVSTVALAQGGPPMVTDDPGTPGDGKWEVNVAATGFHARKHWEIAAPDADINYGLGEHIQLKADIPWVFVHDDEFGRKNGLGAGNFGVKWRFVDQEDAGFAMSTYPQYTRSILKSSERRSITDGTSEFFLPIEASTELGGFGLDAEIGRNFIQHGTSNTAAGLVIAHECGGEVECLGEVRENFASHRRLTLLNVGVRAKINEGVSLIGSMGREFGHPAEDRRNFLLYVGVQLQR